MPVFKKFGLGDQIDNVLVLEPAYELSSGTIGWRGSPEGSASLSLYGGARRRGAVYTTAEYQSLARHPQIGNPIRRLPMTASVNLVWLTNEGLNLSERSHDRWGSEHWRPIMRLHDDQPISPEFTTASYDYYSVFFQKNSSNIILLDPSNDGPSGRLVPTGSFTLESWINPFLTASASRDFTIQSYNGYYWWGITGSSGRLSFSSSLGVFSSSFGPTPGVWSHASVAFDAATLTGTFYLNLTHAGDFILPSGFATASFVGLWTIGNSVSASAAPPNEFFTDEGFTDRSFHGLMGEQRWWHHRLPWAELSSSHNRRLSGSELGGPIACVQLNDGPLAYFRWPAAFGFADSYGSGSLNVATKGAELTNIARFVGFNRSGPIWQPNDNPNFYPPKQVVRSYTSGTYDPTYTAEQGQTKSLSSMVVVDIPSAFFGNQISPGSVKIVDRSWSGPNYGFVRTLVDDGRGGLYVSGSLFSGTLAQPSQESVTWRKVGNVFYGEGLITIKDPALFDIGRIDGSSATPEHTFELSFRGTSKIPVKTLMCRIEHGQVNATLNPTSYTVDIDGTRVRKYPTDDLYVSTVGVYNSDRELVGIARLADPLRVRARDRLCIRLRMDF